MKLWKELKKMSLKIKNRRALGEHIEQKNQSLIIMIGTTR